MILTGRMPGTLISVLQVCGLCGYTRRWGALLYVLCLLACLVVRGDETLLDGRASLLMVLVPFVFSGRACLLVCLSSLC